MAFVPAELHTMDVGTQSLDAYRSLIGREAVKRIRTLAEPLRGRRVLYLNATGYGGGVAEMLRSLVPLLRDVGVEADWATMFGDREFFEVTKALHNSLQGGEWTITDDGWQEYLRTNAANAEAIADAGYELIVVNDPQPAPLIAHIGGEAKWIWRCHIDTSEPDPEAWERLAPFVARYDARVFSMPQFVPEGVPPEGLHIIAPAIDPLSPKNVELPWGITGGVLRWIGIDLTRPVVCQVARFDPWKDPLGVIDAWRLARRQVPNLQLALVGSIPGDDPEGWRILREIAEYDRPGDDLFVFSNQQGVGNIEVNSFQRVARCVIQKSIREGFGLTVSEALYKGTPVVAGDTGGIPAQLRDGRDGYLVDTVEGCAERIVELVRDPGRALALGRSGREHVIERFLLPRLLADELGVLAAPRSASVAAGAA